MTFRELFLLADVSHFIFYGRDQCLEFQAALTILVSHLLYMNGFSGSFFPLVLLFLTGCAYDTEEIYYKEIPPPDHQITFTLEKYDNVNVIYLTGPETFSFEVGITPGRIEQVQMLLDGEVLLTSQGGKINYPFDDDLIKAGTYELTIQFVATPGTGSLAESTGFEKVTMSRKWTVHIDV